MHPREIIFFQIYIRLSYLKESVSQIKKSLSSDREGFFYFFFDIFFPGVFVAADFLATAFFTTFFFSLNAHGT